MAKNVNMKVNLIKPGQNYTINNQWKSRKLETTSDYLSLFDLDKPQEKFLSRIPVSNQFKKLQEVEELPGKDTTDRKIPQLKPLRIHIEAPVIVLLIELLKKIDKNE
ncbi:hypothetical protein M0804_014073 [Polistes exclamans]|nr:hypothetical protein M0804_014073 [Polistes exclamans]